MSNQEKRHRTNMQHLRYLNSFMDEIDREVMSLTDRAFKSLCIGDEAIYNDSEFSPSPVSCHKPVVEDVSKKTQESTFSAVKKNHFHPRNGTNDLLSLTSKSSKDTSLFAAFAAKKNGESTKITNGDSWDKSALLSIQRELSEFSSDYHNLTVKHLSEAKNHLKSNEKWSAKKSSKDESNPSGKSSKSKHSKNNKLRKLNYINFFLHSEFSPFLSWRDFNKSSTRQEHISEIMLSNRPPEWYDSPLYKELTAAHGRYKLRIPPSVEIEVKNDPKPSETHAPKPQPASVPSAPPTVPPKPEKVPEHIQLNIPINAPSLASEQRCNSERSEPSAPWRKSRTRAKSAAPVGHSINSPACERTNALEGSVQAFRKEVKTIEDQASASSTPFSISQLLTPVIPSRHGTGTSEIMQTVLSPSSLEIPPLPERDLHPSPEIKREGYKSIASSLLFNLKDNRKRVKTMYSPPKFKGSDALNQSKGSSPCEVSKDGLEIPAISGAKTISPARQKAINPPMSPLVETPDAQTCSPANDGVPDDYLALSLLQSGKVKSNRSPAANKAAYPSLQLYRKASAEEINIRANADTKSQVFTAKVSNENVTEDHPSKLSKAVELQSKTITSTLNITKHTEKNIENESGQSPGVNLANSEEQAISDDTNQIRDRLKARGIVSAQKSPVKEKEPNRKEAGAKHVFSSRQNNYIKSQRIVSTDDDNDRGDSSDTEKQPLTVKDENDGHSKNTKTTEIRQEEHNASTYKEKVHVDRPLLKEGVHVREEANAAKEQSSVMSNKGLERQQKEKSETVKRLTLKSEEANNEEAKTAKEQSSVMSNKGLERQQKEKSETMKGNTSIKRALFASLEQSPNRTNAQLKKENLVLDKYDLAKMALEEVIADREQRKLKSKTVAKPEGSLIDRKGVGCEKPQDELPTSRQDQLPSMFMLDEKTKSTKDAKGQNTGSAFKTNWQTVETISEDMAKHGKSHVPEVKLARHCKQEASIGQCQHAEPIKYNERDRACQDNLKDNDTKWQKKELSDKNISRAKKSTKTNASLEGKDIHIVGQSEEEFSVVKKGIAYKPETPLRRRRSHSQGNRSVVEKAERDLDIKRKGDTVVKTKEMESREVGKVESSHSKTRGPVRGNVSALKDKYDRESKVKCKDVMEGVSVEGTCSKKSVKEGPVEKDLKDTIKHKLVTPKVTVSDPESGTYSIIYKELDSERTMMSSSLKESERGEEHSGSERKPTQDFHNDKCDLMKNKNEEDNKEKMIEKEESSVSLKESGDKQNKSKGPSKSYVKDFLSGLLGLSGGEKIKTVDEHEEELSESLSSGSFKTDKARKNSITVYDILGNSHPVFSLNGKHTHHSSRSSNSSEFSLIHESGLAAQPEELRKAEICSMNEKVDGDVKDNFRKPTMDSWSLSNNESESDVSDRVVSPPSDVDNRGWVHSLIESARNITQVSHSHSSSKDQEEIVQQLSPKIHLNESEKDEKDLDLSKHCAQSPITMAKSPQPAMHYLSLPATHLIKDRKLSVGSASVSEEEERRSAVSTLSEGLDGYETSGGDLMEENLSSTAPTEDAEGSQEPSERSASVCSGNDSHGQNKPPVVPPKTEKALRRAMKLTTRRIQKAEAKSKSDRKGRSSDKSVTHKSERRHHSTDKVHDRSEHRSLSSDRMSSKPRELHDDKFEPETQRSEKHSRHHNGHKSQKVEEDDPSRKRQHATEVEDRQTGDSRSHPTENQHHLENGVRNEMDRLGRSNEKYLPKKLERRTQSLDRFLIDKQEKMLSSSGKTGGEMKSEGSQYSTPKALPLRQNSIEHTYAPAPNIVTQPFPITQRKLLQDPDSGMYFLVDMPVQVKTKTFFDPETKSYVQLPVQSPEAAVRQAPPLEVMNTPQLMVYHGFVPVPVPSQKSVVRTAGSMIPPEDLDDFEPDRKQRQEDFYQVHDEEINAYIEPVYIPQEHTPEEEIDSVR